VIRTLPLSADYTDTKRRIAPTARLIGSWNVETRGIGGIGRLMAATDASVGRLTSTYWELLNGDASAYAASSSGPPETLDARGHGSRRAIGAFANWEVEPAARLRVTAGARYDWLTDHFAPVLPADRPSLVATHTAWSPRVGANVRLLESERQELGAYVSVGRSFKAPTMDQLFDQRSIPVPFPPYSITTSSSLLVPQTGTGVEGGLRQRVELWNGRASGRWSVTAYEMDMRHELDFDLAAFHFVNVAESRHRGIEAAADLAGPDATTTGFTYTLQSAVATNGANAGHNLRTIPRHTMTARVSRDPVRGLSLSASAVHVQGAPFDDVNSSDLPSYTRVDARAAYGVGVARLVAEMRNALNASYSSTGFPDPGGSDVRFYYPAAGRVLSVGVEARW
jgi:outer membrane receptor protein involved in Fe transport